MHDIIKRDILAVLNKLADILKAKEDSDTAEIKELSNHVIHNVSIFQDEDNAPKEIVNALRQKEKLLCLFSEEDFNQPFENWGNYLYPAHKIEGLNYAYYAFMKMI